MLERYQSLVGTIIAVLIACITIVANDVLQRHDLSRQRLAQHNALIASFVAETCAIGRQASANIININEKTISGKNAGLFIPIDDIFRSNLDKIGVLSVLDIDVLYRIHNTILSLEDMGTFPGVSMSGKHELLITDMTNLGNTFLIQLKALEKASQRAAVALEWEVPGIEKCAIFTNGNYEWIETDKN